MKSASTSSQQPRTVFIGSEPLLAAWNACGGQESQVIAVPLTDLAFAIELIGEAQPEVVVIEQAVAASGDGSTLMDRLHSERYLRGTQVRLLPPDRAAALIASGPGDAPPQAWLADLAHALPPRPERRAQRIRAADDEQVFVDGQPVRLIDLSAVGAQVRSETVLKPRQRIRVVLAPERGSVKAVAVVAWSTFEIGPTPTYRAGVAFTRAIPDLA
ncbi:MAG TPA: PilZ domain-containing protein [Vicinamibacterales bacterium]|nr:PilZ domain-containing protein [Vicinamibacterales bacterium]